jgi:hypothetical protein
VFPGNGNNRQSKGLKFFNPNVTDDSAVRTLTFPSTDESTPGPRTDRPIEQTKRPAPMSFPDKTGTGDFIFDVKHDNGHRLNASPSPGFGSQYATSDSTANRKARLRFPQNTDNTGTMKFPQIFHGNSLDNNGQNTATSFKFPLGEERQSD